MTLSVDEAMRAFEPAFPLGVAFSGGADSTALLAACAAKWPGQVVALHVNHGLQQAASDFELQCRRTCDALNVPLTIQKVDASARPGQSPEDAARQARYKAFDALTPAISARAAIKSIAIAQHADDQVETILLALSRGAGLAGLSAMPGHWQRNGVDFYRPFLLVAGADLRVWLAEKSIGFVEDPTNADLRYTRNRIRAKLLPELESAFPHFRDTLARSASHAAQAQGLLDELAATDFAVVANSEVRLPLIQRVQKLSLGRQANVIRFWLKSTHGVIPSSTQLDQLLHQIAACTTRGHRIHIKVGHGFVERRGSTLVWYLPEDSRL